MRYLPPSALILGIALIVLTTLLPDATARGEESPSAEIQGWCYEGCPPDGDVQELATFGKWSHVCLTHNADTPQLESLAGQSLSKWGTVSPIADCGTSATPDISLHTVPNGSLGTSVLGQAGWSSSGGTIVHCNVDIVQSGVFLGVVAHEVGHCLGLGHSTFSDQLMSPFCCHDLNYDDIAGIQSLYGSVPSGTVVPTQGTTQLPTSTPTSGACVGLACVTRTPTPPPPVRRAVVPLISRD